MEFATIGRKQIADTDVTITIKDQENENWKKRADLAAKIANDSDYQKAVLEFVETGVDKLTHDEPFVFDGVIGQKFSTEAYLDSEVKFAAYSAVLNQIKSQSK